MVQKTGDDITAAKRFMTVCHENLSRLVSQDGINSETAISLLADIQSYSKIMHARSIYKAAQDVIVGFEQKVSPEDCAMSVAVLKKLVRQYDNGLQEVLPQAKAEDVTSQDDIISVERKDDETAQAAALKTLKPLLKMAKPGPELDSLTRLVRHAESERSDKPAEKALPRDRFESIMPALTNDILRVARQEDKTVSVSVAADKVKLETGILMKVQQALCDVGVALVRQTVEHPLKRQNAGLSQSAHMAFTARLQDNALQVLVSCEGLVPSQSPSSEAISRLTDMGAWLQMSNKEHVTKVEIFNIPLVRDANGQSSNERKVAI